MTRIFLAIAALGALAACGQAQQEYPSHYQFGFMQACEAQGPAAGVCDCTWRRITEEIPRADFERFERMSEEDRNVSPLKAQFEGIAMACGAAAAPPAEPVETTEPSAP